jgi:LysR family glycine cleavage system transcriptional activator
VINPLLPLDSLPFFDASMRHSSFAAAAAELNVTPSAVSQRIKSLEQALGIVLFERLPHGLKPTEAARLFLLEVRPALHRLRVASTRITARGKRRPAGRGQKLSVDMLPALATARFGSLLGSFNEHFPDVELRLSSSPALSDPARDGFDCCVRYGAGGWQGVDAQRLSDEDVFPVCAPALLVNHSPITRDSDFARFPLIHDLMPIGWSEWLAAFAAPEIEINGPVFSDSSLALRAASEGLGIALGRSKLVGPDLDSGRLVRASTNELRSPFSYWLVRPSGRRDALVDLFKEWLVAECFGERHR